MKIILSRKGMDSSYGGHPSIIIDDKLISLPIPSSCNKCTYSEILSGYNDYSMYELIIKTTNKIKIKNWVLITKETQCHLDPDIVFEHLNRQVDWKGSLGQVGAAQTVLKKNDISMGDIFLFFGWFREYQDLGNGFICKSMSDKHIIYGYLQVGSTIYPDKDDIPQWLLYHPHVNGDKNNCIYVAADVCSWNKNLPGYGVFRFDDRLYLTKNGYTRSKWSLPGFFKEVNIGYHSKNSWKTDYFQSANRGQEFVVSENMKISDWAINLIEECSYRES